MTWSSCSVFNNDREERQIILIFGCCMCLEHMEEDEREREDVERVISTLITILYVEMWSEIDNSTILNAFRIDWITEIIIMDFVFLFCCFFYVFRFRSFVCVLLIGSKSKNGKIQIIMIITRWNFCWHDFDCITQHTKKKKHNILYKITTWMPMAALHTKNSNKKFFSLLCFAFWFVFFSYFHDFMTKIVVYGTSCTLRVCNTVDHWMIFSHFSIQ